MNLFGTGKVVGSKRNRQLTLSLQIQALLELDADDDVDGLTSNNGNGKNGDLADTSNISDEGMEIA